MRREEKRGEEEAGGQMKRKGREEGGEKIR